METVTNERQALQFLNELNQLGLTQTDIKELVIATLYHSGKIGGRKACEMLGVARRVFEEDILAKYGFTTYGMTQEDIEREVKGL